MKSDVRAPWGRWVGALIASALGLPIALAVVHLAGPSAPRAPPPDFAFEPIREGDQGAYVWSGPEGAAPGRANGTFFSWSGSSLVDSEGRERSALRLDVRPLAPTLPQDRAVVASRSFFFESGETLPWATESTQVALERYSFGRVPPRPDPGAAPKPFQAQAPVHRWHRSLEPDQKQELPPCGLAWSLLPPSAAGRASWEVPPCLDPQGRVMRAAGYVLTHAGSEGVWIAHSVDAALPVYWFREGIPYPVVVSLPRAPHGGGLEAVLTGFTRGTGAITSNRPADPVPPRQDAPWHVWGPPEQGSDHEFPLSTAWRVAVEHPLFAELRDFMAERPEARVQSAQYERASENGAWIRHRWRLLVSDGEAALHVCVASGRPLGAPTGAPHHLGMLEARPQRCPGSLPRLVAPDAYPAEFPTLGHLRGLWARHTGEDPPRFNAWAFEFVCDGPCARPQLRVFAGRVGVELAPAQPGQGLGYDYRTALIELDATGHVVGVHRASADYAYVDENTVVRVDASRAAPANEPAASVPGGPPDWRAGDVIAAAAVPLALGLLVYRFWPMVQAGLAWAGFTRLSPRLLAEHPVRARLVRLIHERPGVHLRGIRAATGLSSGHALHHLRILASAGAVVSFAGGGRTCYFPPGTDRRLMAAAAVTVAEPARRILQGLALQPGESVTFLAARLGLPRSLTGYHVGRLRAHGLVETGRNGATTVLQLTGAGRLWIQRQARPGTEGTPSTLPAPPAAPS